MTGMSNDSNTSRERDRSFLVVRSAEGGRNSDSGRILSSSEFQEGRARLVSEGMQPARPAEKLDRES
jgi:hypothetical protein